MTGEKKNNSLRIWCEENGKANLILEYSDKNAIPMDNYTYGSGKYAWWKCSKCGYEWESKIGNRTILERGCPKCGRKSAGNNIRKTKAEKNCLLTQHPDIASDWDYKNNYPLTPDEISSGSDRKVFWVCSWCGNNYKMAINKRTRRHYGCPRCGKQSTSFPEQAIFYYLKKVFTNTKNRDTSLGFEVDIFVPELGVAIEYDGVRWHNTEDAFEKDNNKDQKCNEKGITLFRFRDPKLNNTDYATCITCIDGDGRSLEEGIKELLVILNIKNVGVNIARDTQNILSHYSNHKKNSSIAIMFPELAAEWDWDKNESLTPEKVSYGFGKKVWWKCSKCGNSFLATPNARTQSKSGCPECARKSINQKNHVKIINLDTGIIYDSLSEAADSCNGRKSDICTCCNGRQKSAFGYRWAYVDKEERRRPHYTGKILCVETGMVFDNDKEAAKWCNGDNRNINSVIVGRNKTYKGYHWRKYEDSSQEADNQE